MVVSLLTLKKELLGTEPLGRASSVYRAAPLGEEPVGKEPLEHSHHSALRAEAPLE